MPSFIIFASISLNNFLLVASNSTLNKLRFEVDTLKMATLKKMHLFSNLKQSVLSKAFCGELIKE
jgi:hypothetical protein